MTAFETFREEMTEEHGNSITIKLDNEDQVTLFYRPEHAGPVYQKAFKWTAQGRGPEGVAKRMNEYMRAIREGEDIEETPEPSAAAFVDATVNNATDDFIAEATTA